MAAPSNTTERRDAIARALLAVMATQGYERASIVDIARAAGLVPGLLHYHFGNKLEILVHAVGTLASQQRERLGDVLAKAPTEPRRRLHALIDAHLALGPGADAAAVACWVAVSAEAIRHPQIRAALSEASHETVGVLREIVGAGMRAKVFRRVDPEAASAAIFAAIHGCLVVSISTPAVIPRGTAAASVRAMADGLLLPRSSRRAADR